MASPQVAFVGTRLDITLLAFDADGDELSFGFRPLGQALGNRAQIVTLADRAVFSWTPSAADVGTHQVDFTVGDGETSNTQTVAIEVRPGTSANTAPIFRRPLGFGTTLDLSKETCVDVDILIEDPDSVKVEVSQEPPIEGSTLTRIGQLSALFHWCPSESQKAQLQHVLRLVANDGDSPPVIKDYMIVLRVPLPTTCPGSPPQVLHNAPADATTLEAITLQATVTDDLGLKGAPVIYHSTHEPHSGPIDVSTMAQLEMTQRSPGFYEASLPNPAKGAAVPGLKYTVYYVIVAEDDDDKTGNCDHRVQAPSESTTFSVEITTPQVALSCNKSKGCPVGEICDGKVCVADTCTPQDANGDKLYWEQSSCPQDHICPLVGPSVTPSHCAASCVDNSDCGSGRVCKVFETQLACGAPGSRPVGATCTTFNQCADRQMCLPWSGGYCSLSDCDSSGSFSGPCAMGSYCYPMPDSRFTLGKHWICVKGCNAPADCRTSEGYACREINDDTQTKRKVCLPKAGS
ncbi:MAG: hypothetical protein CSB49_06860 [Proteobacteria bacterium]|nr:MAG: hypothetical protein CSB49_06860 [Pseudomonadota bacterium]